MKSFRGFIVLLLSFFCSIMVHAQKEYNGVMTGTSPHGINVAKDDVSAPMTKNEIKRFYRKLIQGEEMKSMLINPPQIKSILDKKQALTQGYDLKTIYHVINNARAFTDGEWLDTIVALSFPNKNVIYFENAEAYIYRIWLPDGSDALNYSSYPYLFMRIAIISDSDGYVNVREKPDAHSKIVDISISHVLKHMVTFRIG
ncbi:hypothetical protein [uncultured Prevotella sp.]|uniref:hypothetical protein n=1 Tax=uncultured Prevotella sp. TaxID=159272 RepID=UPI00258E262B|nr:hypothetical protein [uncultured Prevotella sp.]